MNTSLTTPVLVIGGAGYIGAHMTLMLRDKGFAPVVLDNFSTGWREAVLGAELIEGDAGDAKALDQLLSQRNFGAVMHFASSSQVGESVTDPAKYYTNNTAATLNLLQALRRHQPDTPFIFSSTAAVYGEPQHTPIAENHPIAPVNPYGRTKSMIEAMLADFSAAYRLTYGALRYFNAAGADPQARIGERHEPETHLIPLALQAASGRRKQFTIHGEDYATRDGTCLRDFVHVLDLCEAHLLLLQHLVSGGEERIFNLGSGTGYTVREVVETTREVTGQAIPAQADVRRPGDPATLVADGSLARNILGWQPRYSLADMIRHAWAWEQKLVQRAALAAA